MPLVGIFFGLMCAGPFLLMIVVGQMSQATLDTEKHTREAAQALKLLASGRSHSITPAGSFKQQYSHKSISNTPDPASGRYEIG